MVDFPQLFTKAFSDHKLNLIIKMIFFFAVKKHCFKGRKQIGESNTYNSTALTHQNA